MALFVLIPLISWAQFGNNKSYDVEGLYRVQDVERGTIGIDTYGKAQKIEKLLIPIRINTGTYSVYIKRIDSNLYEVIGKNIYIMTKYCFEYTYGDDAILKITSSYGYTIGTLIFIK